MPVGRNVKRKRLRKRRIKLLISILSILFLSTLGYTALQFAVGKDEGNKNGGIASNIENKEDIKDFENHKMETKDKQQYQDHKINVLLVGSDQRDAEVARTDTIMIGQYDKESGETKLVSIMRDTYVDIPGYGYNKINASYALGGIILLTKTIEKNFGVQIDHFTEVNFEGFIHIINEIAPNGIEMKVEKRMKYQDNAGTVNIDLYPGVQKLNGSQLLDYARFRADAKSDFGRVERQQKVISLLKDEILSFTNIHKLPKTFGMVTSYVNTDMSQVDIGKYATNILTNHEGNTEKLRIPVEGSYWNETYQHAGAVLAHDESQNRKSLQSFLGVNEDKKEESGKAG